MTDCTATGTELVQLAFAARAGDRNALSELADKLRPTLFAAAYSHTRHFDDAQDAVGNALLRVCRSISTLRDPAQINAWAVRIVRNEAYRLRPMPSALPDDLLGNSDLYASDCLTRIDVERALRALPRDEAEATTLFYMHSLPVATIASRLNRPAGTIKYWLFRSRARLTTHLKGYNMDTTATPANAAIWSSELAPALVAQMTQALKTAGWSSVRFVNRFDALAQAQPGQEPPMKLINPVPDCRCIVLDEIVDGHSAFEIARLLRATPEGKAAALFLLADSTGDSSAFQLTALAAYMAGFDMLLSKPFELEEFTNFARRLKNLPIEQAEDSD